jgi:NADH-ubiquinone oxidoreductase chain 6
MYFYKENNNYENSIDIHNNVLFVSNKTWDGNLTETSHITSIGNIIYTNNNILLIIVSFILLLAMVGSIVITMKQRSNFNENTY